MSMFRGSNEIHVAGLLAGPVFDTAVASPDEADAVRGDGLYQEKGTADVHLVVKNERWHVPNPDAWDDIVTKRGFPEFTLTFVPRGALKAYKQLPWPPQGYVKPSDAPPPPPPPSSQQRQQQGSTELPEWALPVGLAAGGLALVGVIAVVLRRRRAAVAGLAGMRRRKRRR